MCGALLIIAESHVESKTADDIRDILRNLHIGSSILLNAGVAVLFYLLAFDDKFIKKP